MKKYIVEIARNEEVNTDGAYLSPDEIVDEVMYNDNNGAGENYEKKHWEKYNESFAKSYGIEY